MKPIDFAGADREYHDGIPCLHSTFDACMEEFAPYIEPASKWPSKLAYGIFKAVNFPIHKKLTRLQKSGPRNWFNESVEQLYLECREGLPFFNHFHVGLNIPTEKTYAERIADVINAIRHLTQSSDGISQVFRNYRQANLVCDFLVTGHSEDCFILLCNGKAYSFRNKPVSAQDIDEFLGVVLQVNHETEATIGHMSACHREEWHRLEQELSTLTDFSLAMHTLRNADFIICLDLGDVGVDSPTGDEQFKFRSIHNRFFDKAIQVVIDQENTYLLFEHAAVDGQHAVELGDELAKQVNNSNSYSISQGNTIYQKLPFSFGNQLATHQREYISSYIRAKKAEFSWCHRIDKRFNKTYLDGLPIDSILQLSAQLAYYRCTDKFPSIYEPVSLRHIPGRRLDFISSFSDAAKNFIDAAVRKDHACAREGLGDAIRHHKRKIKNAKQGKGAISHIMALSAVEFSDDKARGVRIQRRRKLFLAKFSKAFRYLIRRDVMASNGGGSDYVNYFGTIIHQADMIGIGYLVNHCELSVDIQVHGHYRAIIDTNRFMEYLIESVSYITALLRESDTSNALLKNRAGI